MKGSRFDGVKRLAPIQEEKEQGLISFGVYKILQPPNEEIASLVLRPCLNPY